MLEHHHTSAINQIRKDDLLRTAADAVHPSHPFHLILGLQPLSDTFDFLHLFDQPIEHLLCCVADFLEMLVQLAGQQHSRVNSVPVLAQIPPALFCKSVAKQKPYYFVMRDSSMASDSVATNFDQIFATYSPDTVRKVL